MYLLVGAVVIAVLVCWQALQKGWVYTKLYRAMVGLACTPYLPYSKPKNERSPKPKSLPSAGQLLVRDFRDSDGDSASDKGSGKVRVVTFNMEMGKQLDKIISELKALQPDILLLQEVDLCVPRSGCVDQVAEVRALHSLNLHPFFSQTTNITDLDWEGVGFE